MKDDLSVCAVFKDEARYLDEWLTFHSHVGVNRFYLYDDESSDDFMQVLTPWIQAGRVVLQPAGGRRQIAINNDCLRKTRFRTRWLAFIDIDEFIWSPTGAPVTEVLKDFSGTAGVLVRWVLFGSSGHETKSDLPAIEAFTKCLHVDRDFDIQQEQGRRGATPRASRISGGALQGKSVVNPRRTYRMIIHAPDLYLGKLVNELAKVLGRRQRRETMARLTFWKETPVDILRINHYWSRSVEEIGEKVSRKVNGSFHRGRGLDYDAILASSIERDAVLNQVTDLSIQDQWKTAAGKRATFLR